MGTGAASCIDPGILEEGSCTRIWADLGVEEEVKKGLEVGLVVRKVSRGFEEGKMFLGLLEVQVVAGE